MEGKPRKWRQVGARLLSYTGAIAVIAGTAFSVWQVWLSTQNEQTSRPVTLDFLWPTYTPQKVRYGEYLAQRYMDENPNVHINLILTYEPYQKLQVMIAGRTTPDVVWMGVGWSQFADAFLPLDGLVDQDPQVNPEDYFPSLWEACKWQGPLLSLPSSGQVAVIYYNKDLFDEAGLEYPTEDWTWDDMVRMGHALTRDFDGDGIIDQYGLQLDQIYRFPFLMYDGQIADPEWETAKMDTPLKVAIMNAYRDLIYKERVMPTGASAGELGMLPAFEEGRYAMHAASAWALETLRKVQFDWDVVTLPWFEFEGRKYRSTGLWQEEFGIVKDSDQIEEAWKFIRFCTSAEMVGWASQEGHIVPGRPDVAYSERFIDPNKRPANIKRFLDSIEFALPVLPHPQFQEMAAEFDPVWQRFFDNTSDKQIDADEAATLLNDALQKVLDDYNARRRERESARAED